MCTLAEMHSNCKSLLTVNTEPLPKQIMSNSSKQKDRESEGTELKRKEVNTPELDEHRMISLNHQSPYTSHRIYHIVICTWLSEPN